MACWVANNTADHWPMSQKVPPFRPEYQYFYDFDMRNGARSRVGPPSAWRDKGNVGFQDLRLVPDDDLRATVFLVAFCRFWPISPAIDTPGGMSTSGLSCCYPVKPPRGEVLTSFPPFLAHFVPENSIS